MKRHFLISSQGLVRCEPTHKNIWRVNIAYIVGCTNAAAHRG